MNYELHTMPEILGGIVFFVLAAIGWWMAANRGDITEDTRSFR